MAAAPFPPLSLLLFFDTVAGDCCLPQQILLFTFVDH
jgi:hypothetical protein